MTLLDPRVQRETAERMLVIAYGNMAALVSQVDALVHRLEEGEFLPPGDLKKTVAELRGVIKTAMDERHRLEDILREQDGRRADAPLDFDDARNKIGSRLARLRAARDSGAVPGEPR